MLNSNIDNKLDMLYREANIDKAAGIMIHLTVI